MDKSGADIVLDNVTFGYIPGREVLKNVSLTINHGQKVAFVGPSGCGKSTIIRLLFRFYDPTSGRILIGNGNISDLTLQSLRRHLAVVPQDTILFNDTIYYNILYGRPTASVEEVEEAAKQAQIHDAIKSHPSGYAAVVGERGLKLSGGEKQRVAIARAIVKEAPIFVFDEATSSLDLPTEADILKSIKDITQNRTTITIAHRLSSIVDADKIFVLKDGCLVESGTHYQLLQNKSIYYSMWLNQENMNTTTQE